MSQADFSHVTFISAGAGSGKTYRLTEDLERALTEDGVHPARVMGTTFTVKAAGELKERVRSRLINSGRLQLSEQMAQALIGTVHSVCERLLKRFSFELGLSPELSVISIEDGERLFRQALDDVLSIQQVRDVNALAARLNQEDWQKEVKRIAEKVRENDLDLAGLPAMAEDSAHALLQYFQPVEQNRDLSAELRNAIDTAIAQIDLQFDTTKGTREYYRLLVQTQHELRRADLPWRTWLKLSTETPAKKSLAHAAPVQQAASLYEAHPQFHADVKTYITQVMTIAGLALERFQTLKTERGLIDFLDMEQLTLHALDIEAIRARIGDELELLMVDEFQDTNPMQLALFVKLASLADRAIFVGDVKQAIYAFRGCDPDLVFETLEGLTKADATKDKLPFSWRSRPPLVDYVNEVFSAAFEEDGMTRDDVLLKPQRQDTGTNPALKGWTLPGKLEVQAADLALRLGNLVASGYSIEDADTGITRPISWGDIAILARTNDHVETIARTLKNQGVPMKMTLSGLLATPEVILARACLRRLNDPTDTLATAEILSLSNAASTEEWLADRLAWVASEQENYRWAEDTNPIVGRLRELRDGTATRSPVEIVARVLNDVGTRAIATSWGPDAIKAVQRQRNLDAFLNLAVLYEDHCAAHHQAGTLTGFLFWLENPSSPELDLQPMVTSGDAVHVLTYHKAKGLEWPVVIACDFNYKSPSSIFDVRVNLTENFDVNQPLANRTLRYWPNVFGKKENNVPPLDRILASEEGQSWAAKSLSEDRRLAYVGLTRARDLLVTTVPERMIKGAWLNCFDKGFTVPSGDSLELPNGKVLASSSDGFGGGAQQVPVQAFEPRWFVQRNRHHKYAKEMVSPSSAQPDEAATITSQLDLGERLPLRSDDMAAVGNALHAIIAAELVNPDQPDAEARAYAMLHAYGVHGTIEAADAMAAAVRLRQTLTASYSATSFSVECPIQHVLEDGRVVRGLIDLVVNTPDGALVIDHKSSPRPRKEWPNDMVEHGGQLRTYRDAVEAANGSRPRLALHFPVSAGLVHTDLNQTSSERKP